jgi:hypothetical protein
MSALAAAPCAFVTAPTTWRIMYRVDPDALLILEVYAKKSRKILQEVMDRCKKRLKDYDQAVKQAVEEPPER